MTSELRQSPVEVARIHRPAITDKEGVRRFLERVKRAGVALEGGLGRLLDREVAYIVAVGEDSFVVDTKNFDLDQRTEVVLSVAVDQRGYLLGAEIVRADKKAKRLVLKLPTVVYRTERRERQRRAAGQNRDVPRRASLRWRKYVVGEAAVIDYSHDGVAVRVPTNQPAPEGERVELEFLDGPEAGYRQTGFVRRRRRSQTSEGWQEVGLSITAAPPGPLLPIERRGTVLPRNARNSLRDRIQMWSGGARIATRRSLGRLGVLRKRDTVEPELLRFENASGEKLVGLLDGHGPRLRSPVVLIPPAWAKTKETLLPLARTIVESFRNAGKPVYVIRLDGIRRRGESHNDVECRHRGRECHHMTFSQGVEDIRATLEFLKRSRSFAESLVALVTFSGSSIEARSFLANANDERIAGWVSVVGAADLKSGLKVVSGGLDYIGGFERGVRFGIQRVLGIETDIDRVCRDALDNRLAHLEDARRQMAQIRVPITWIQGRNDAWIDSSRVQEILSVGDVSNRRLIEVPTGHQLRTSREALDTFRLIAGELAGFFDAAGVTPVIPDLADVERRRRAERARLPRQHVDLKEFWTTYLFGRDGFEGMELLAATTVYQEFLEVEVRALGLRGDERVADLGSGTGALLRFLSEHALDGPHVRVDEFDYLQKALATARASARETIDTERLGFVVADLNFGQMSRHIPVRDSMYDAVFASLVLNYVADPSRLLRESRRILRRGGRLVLSVLRRDADISGIYKDVEREVRNGTVGRGTERFSEEDREASVRSLLNEAAQLLDLEESGVFTFWESDELKKLVEESGFRNVTIRRGFGAPPQAIVVSAMAP